jgi:transcription initiation factor TFIIB
MSLNYNKPNNFNNESVINNFNEDELFELLDQIDYEKESKELKKIEGEIDDKICKVCNTGDNIAEDTAQGINVCMGCGTILSEIFDDNPEWRQYGGDDAKEGFSRCNGTTNFFLPQSSLGTSIACSNKSKIKILHGWSAMPYKERSLNVVLKEIQNKCRIAGIMKCIEDDAKILYKNISESKHLFGKNKGKNVIIRGSNRRSLIASCIFFACKRKGNTRSPKEIAKLFDLKYKSIAKGCKMFQKLIKLKQLQYDTKISNPEHFITRYCRELHITNEYINQANKIAKNIQKLKLASMHTPFSVATGSILLIVCLNNLNIERKVIANKFGISEVTVIKTYKKIEEYKNILINDELTDKIVNLLNEERKKMEVPNKLKEMYKKFNMEKDDIIPNYIDDDSDEYLSDDDSDEYIFKITYNNIDEYINNINIDLYDLLSITENNYKQFINNMYD